eukprot:scaffold109004_cov81-Cyclotella_meneghiniana.AAC.1
MLILLGFHKDNGIFGVTDAALSGIMILLIDSLRCGGRGDQNQNSSKITGKILPINVRARSG